MAPINIEDTIREKMQERELQPSPDAWERLEAKLGDEKSAGSNRMTWFAIAASFIGILVLTSVFMNSDSDGNSDLVVQDSSEIIAPETLEDLPKTKIESQELAVEVISSELNDKKSINQSLIEQPKPEIAKITIPVKQNNTPVAENNIEVRPKTKLNNLIIDQETFIANKVDEVVAQVKNKASTNETVTAEEIDALLSEAQREIANQRILNSQSKKVDAAALLSDIEFELERGFRDRVFDLLGDGYKKVRTAVAERNY